jgi:DNA-binding NtrC family response regulator
VRILVADDDATARRVLERMIGQAGHEPIVATSGDEAWSLFRTSAPEVVISDWFMPGVDGLELCRRIRAAERESYVYVILITGSRGHGGMLQAMESGADDFLTKPVDPEELGVRLVVASRITSLYRRTMQAEALAAALEDQARSGVEMEGMIGRSEAIQNAFRRIRLAAKSDVTVLFTGESGTGKEMAARALHAQSARGSGPFLAVNCGAIPETLLESELFGHVKGAFTGAYQNRVGLFVAADGGTLFLDEIGDVSPVLQLKVLRALQEREVRRIGEEQGRKVDVRIVAATNRDLKRLVEQGQVREDFFYRIRVFEIALPPLRARREDIPLLAERLLADLAATHKRKPPRVGADALTILMDYRWPGNIRELRNALEHALVVSQEETVGIDDLPVEIREPGPDEARPPGDLGEEGRRILDALREAGGNRVEAAKQLGISRVTLWKKLKRLGIQPDAPERRD